VRNSVSYFEGGNRLRVFENRMLSIFGPKTEGDGSWRKLHNDELHSLYSSTNIFTVIKSRKMGWALLGGSKGRDHWEDQDVGEIITIRWTLEI
jgi:hypothetical protein